MSEPDILNMYDALKRECDQLRKQNEDLLYVVTKSDVKAYYDSQHEDGAFDSLTPEKQSDLIGAVNEALEWGMETQLAIVMEAGIEEFERFENDG